MEAELVKLRHAGWSVADLCKKFGVCKSTAYNWIREYSPIRKPSIGRIITPTDYRRLEREAQTLRTENEIFRRCGFLSEVPLEDKLTMIDSLSADFSVHMLCKTLGVLKSTCYHRKLRSPDKKWYELNDEELRPLVQQIFVDSRERFGANKIKYALAQLGYTVSQGHIIRLMKEMDLVCKQVRLRYFSTTNRKYKYYRNRVQRNFDAESPNMVWVSDISNVYVKDVLYSIAVIIDLFARVVVACDVSKKSQREFCEEDFRFCI